MSTEPLHDEAPLETTDAAPQAAPAPQSAPPEGVKSWPDDWRQKIAGDDAKELKRLERFQDVGDVYKAYREVETKWNSREITPTLPEGATEEDVAAYRKAAGIPEKPEGYYESFKEIVVGDDDKPILDDFLGKMHASNMPPAQVQEAVNWYFSEMENRQQALAEIDTENKAKGEDQLREEWGGDFRINLSARDNLMAGLPEGLQESLLEARLPDGTKLGHSVDFNRWLVAQARELNPVATLVPSNGGDPINAIAEEKKTIEGVMRTDRRSYDKDPQMQKRYLELLEAEGRLQKRAS